MIAPWASRAGLQCLAIGALLILAAVTAQPAAAQGWPQRPVKLIIPFGAGSSTDVAGRLIADKLQAAWGKPVVIEPRPGGDALVAINAFTSANDDHTLLLIPSSAFVAHPFRYKSLPYDRERDLVPVAQISVAVAGMAVPAASGVKTLKDFIDGARENPGKFNVAAAPSTSEMMVDVFVKEQGLSVTKVPYRDPVQAVIDLTTGRLNAMFAAVSIFQAGVNAGTLRLVSVTGRERTPIAPDVATAEEQGYPRLGIEGVIGLFAPRSMPADVRDRLTADVLKAATDKDVTTRLTAIGQVSAPGDAAALAASIARQQADFEAISKVVPVELK
jgi:tripartite-type tricarboxylate transporter receptor subunit TctC